MKRTRKRLRIRDVYSVHGKHEQRGDHCALSDAGRLKRIAGQVVDVSGTDFPGRCAELR